MEPSFADISESNYFLSGNCGTGTNREEGVLKWYIKDLVDKDSVCLVVTGCGSKIT